MDLNHQQMGKMKNPLVMVLIGKFQLYYHLDPSLLHLLQRNRPPYLL